MITDEKKRIVIDKLVRLFDRARGATVIALRGGRPTDVAHAGRVLYELQETWLEGKRGLGL